MMDFKKLRRPGRNNGFTLIEIIMVVVILGIAAMIAVPMLSSAADMKVRAAANRLAADLDYAKGMAVTHQKGYAVVFDPANESYDIRVEPYGTVNIIDNPVRPNTPYRVDFTTDSNMSQVKIDTVAFNSATNHTIVFDYLGSPFCGDPVSALNSGRITLQAGDFTIYVDIEPMTGYVTITGP